MGKAKEGQKYNIRKSHCGCIKEDGTKCGVEIEAGEGYIVWLHSRDYKVYCRACYPKIASATATNITKATVKEAGQQGRTTAKKEIKEAWQHTFEFSISNKNLNAINLLKRLHYTVVKGNQYTVRVISGKENNLNGINKNFTNLVDNFKVKASTKVKIITFKENVKVSTAKTTLDKAVELAKELRV